MPKFLILFLTILLEANGFEEYQNKQSNYMFLDFSCKESLQVLKPKLSLLDYDMLLRIKSKIHTSEYRSAYNTLIEDAQKCLNEGPFSVVNKTQIPPSGDKHDYLSYGPYWWPDPNKSDGLPWIRRDGEVNPLTREGNTDFGTKKKMFNSTFTLALAYFFSDNENYGYKALELINSWFLDNATKMNPNLEFAQGIPGKNSGRGIGIIEFADITNMISSIEILQLKGIINDQKINDLKNWFTQYLKWLQTSENGIFEKNTKNNHAVWYDVQVVSILMYLERVQEAKIVLEEVNSNRICKQIMADGSQPYELERTKSLSYSTMNLRGFTMLAYFGKILGVDLWNYKSENGASIIKAYEFLIPYAKNEKKWNYKQISGLSDSLNSLRNLFIQAGSQFNIDLYCSIGKSSNKESHSLLDNCF